MTETLLLCLHGVGEMPGDREPQEQAYWLSISAFEALLERVLAHNAHSRVQVGLTFDDGNKSDLDVVCPMLLEAGLGAIFFFATDLFDKTGYISGQDVQRIAATAGMEIGVHGTVHHRWTEHAPTRIRQEMLEARRILANLSGGPITHIAPPYGAWSAALASIARREGFRQFHTCNERPGPQAAYLQHRLCIRAGDDVAALLEQKSSRQSVLRARLRALYPAPLPNQR